MDFTVCWVVIGHLTMFVSFEPSNAYIQRNLSREYTLNTIRDNNLRQIRSTHVKKLQQRNNKKPATPKSLIRLLTPFAKKQALANKARKILNKRLKNKRRNRHFYPEESNSLRILSTPWIPTGETSRKQYPVVSTHGYTKNYDEIYGSSYTKGTTSIEPWTRDTPSFTPSVDFTTGWSSGKTLPNSTRKMSPLKKTTPNKVSTSVHAGKLTTSTVEGRRVQVTTSKPVSAKNPRPKDTNSTQPTRKMSPLQRTTPKKVSTSAHAEKLTTPTVEGRGVQVSPLKKTTPKKVSTSVDNEQLLTPTVEGRQVQVTTSKSVSTKKPKFKGTATDRGRWNSSRKPPTTSETDVTKTFSPSNNMKALLDAYSKLCPRTSEDCSRILEAIQGSKPTQPTDRRSDLLEKYCNPVKPETAAICKFLREDARSSEISRTQGKESQSTGSDLAALFNKLNCSMKLDSPDCDAILEEIEKYSK